jgi:opacity protein-like surface antigen
MGSPVLFYLGIAIPPASAGSQEDIYISLYLFGSLPYDRPVQYNGVQSSGSSIENGGGGGLKAALFPDFTKRMLGLELESFGLLGGFTFPVQTGGGSQAIGSTKLAAFNSMVNLIVRYPGRLLQPYAGIGAGISEGVLFNSDFPGRSDRDFETSPTLGHQFLAGLQGNLSERTFLFGEYKYFSANYHWDKLSLDFRANYVLAGFGLRF